MLGRAFSVWRMLSAAESTWLLRKSGSWRLTAISASAWNFPFDAIELDGDELGVLLRAAERSEGARRSGAGYPGATGRSIVITAPRGRGFFRLRPVSCSFIVCRKRSSAVFERRSGQGNSQQAIQSRCPGFLRRHYGRLPAAPSGAGRDAPHLQTAGDRSKARPGIGRQARDHRHERRGRLLNRRGRSTGGLPGRVDLGVDGGTGPQPRTAGEDR